MNTDYFHAIVAEDRRGRHDLNAFQVQKEDKSKLEQSFGVGITSTFTAMREDLEKTVNETNAYADKILGLVNQLEETHLRSHVKFKNTKEHSEMNKEKFDGLFSAYSFLLDELAPWRAQVIQSGEETTEVQSTRMRKSRMDTMNTAKRRLDEGREKQLLATDASELIKYYKALITAT